MAVQDKKPLYLAGLPGGATRQIIDTFEGKPVPPDFCHVSAMQELYGKAAVLMLERDTTTPPDREVDPERVWSIFEKIWE